MPDCLIELQEVFKSFGDTEILKEVSLKINKNQILTILGPNGAGKTTLLRIILGIIKPDKGKIIRQDMSIGYMPQKLQINKWMPINVLRFLSLTPKIKISINEISEKLKIKNLLYKQVLNLSGGELQKVLLAKALLKKPSLLVLDEPAQGIDVIGQVELYKLLQNIKKDYECGVVIVSHDLHLVMSETDEVVCLNRHVCCYGTPENIKEHEEFKQLFGSSVMSIYTHNHDHRH